MSTEERLKLSLGSQAKATKRKPHLSWGRESLSHCPNAVKKHHDSLEKLYNVETTCKTPRQLLKGSINWKLAYSFRWLVHHQHGGLAWPQGIDNS